MRTRAGVLLSLALSGPVSVSAQGGVIAGAVRDSATARVLPGVVVHLMQDGRDVTSRVADERGRFRLSAQAGNYTLRATRVGYTPREWPGVVPGRDTALVLTMVPVGIPLDPVVVTATRSPETALDAPAAVSVVDRQAIAAAVTLNPVENIRTVPGVDFASKGLIQHTFAVRGERGANSSALLMLTDYRYASVPSIAYDVPYLMPATDDDVERIEVVRGPGAALYGPGSARGVLHVITRSPFESPGATVSLSGGERDLVESSLRVARIVSPSLAFKISGDYVRGRDWPYADSTEVANRAQALAAGADPATLRIGLRDSTVSRVGGEARVDWRAGATDVVGSFGMAQAIRAVDLTPAVGSVEASDWRYSYAQLRARRDRLFVNLMYDVSNAGDTYLLRTGANLVDNSRLYAAQIQNGATAGRLDLLYGADVRWTDPRTGGTIDGANEADDLVFEAGAYAYGTMALGPRVDLHAALRADHHNRLNDVVLSPRLAVVVKPGATQALRLSYNRAFTSPETSDLFLDIVGGTLPGLPYAVRAVGVPLSGYTFPRTCGGLCMRSPFAAQPGAYIPAEATQLWSTVVALAKQRGVDLTDIPAPTPADVGTTLAALNLFDGTFTPITPADVKDIEPLRRTITNAVELGYRGQVAGYLGLDVDVYVNHLTDIQGARVAATPSVFFDEPSLERYLERYRTPAEAAQLAALIAQVPAGTISPTQTPHAYDILIVNQQGGAYTFWGADLSAELALSPRVMASGSVSWVNTDSFPDVAVAGDQYLNAPRRKAAVALEYHGPTLTAAVRGRAIGGFPVVSGVIAGRVDPYAVLDATAGYRLHAAPDVWLTVSGQNLLDNRHQEFVAAPEIGRLILTRLRVTW